MGLASEVRRSLASNSQMEAMIITATHARFMSDSKNAIG